MRRNDFNKRINVYSVQPVADGYGGYSTSATLVNSLWAKVEPLGAGSNVTEYGLEDASKSVRFTIRKNNTFLSSDYFIEYRDVMYKITSAPIEINFENRFVEFIGTELVNKSNVEVPVDNSFYASGFYESGFYEGAS
jgi:SPP1 family predicted phage head-tail adaptor